MKVKRTVRHLGLMCVATAFGLQACNGLATLENRPCPCADGWTCCEETHICVAQGGSCQSNPTFDAQTTQDVNQMDGSSPLPVPNPPPCTTNCTPTTLLALPNAFRLACSPEVLYAGTTDGQIVAVPLATLVPAPVAPAPAGVVGFMSWFADRLLYTLPQAGEVYARDVARGTDLRLATNQPAPQGIAGDGADVFFATANGVASVSYVLPDQTPTPRVTFADAGLPRGEAMGLALAAVQPPAFGARMIVAHSPVPPDSLSGGLATYASTGEQISMYTFFSKTIGVATSPTRTYWTESDGTLRAGPKPIMGNGLTPVWVVTNQLFLGDLCVQDGRLYFTATNDNDVREIRYVDVE